MDHWIQRKVTKVQRKADTQDPFVIAEQLHIIVLLEELGSIRGYYNTCSRQPFIHINRELSKEDQRFTCAHELGHAVLHPKSSTPFLRENTLFSINRLEREANCFAAALLCGTELLEEAQAYGYTTAQIAAMSGVPEPMVRHLLLSG